MSQTQQQIAARLMRDHGSTFASEAGIQLAVHPLACRSLFGVPAGELSVTEYDGREVLGRRAVITQQRLTETSAWSAAFGIVMTVIWLYVEILRILAIIREMTSN